MKRRVNRNDFTFSKRLTVVDTVSWTLMVLLLIVAILLVPSAATYCVNLATTITAAYVSLRLGYTGKAAIENYKKINNTMTRLQAMSSQEQNDQDEPEGGNG